MVTFLFFVCYNLFIVPYIRLKGGFIVDEIYEFFKKCVMEENSKEWNLFRRKNRKIKIDFTEGDFSNIKIHGFNMKGIVFNGADFSQIECENCIFDQCQMEEIQAFGAVFLDCSFVSASMKHGNYVTCKFGGSDLRYADFENSRIHQSYMKGCIADDIIMRHVSFYETCLTGSTFTFSDFSGSDIKNVGMYSADFTGITVDGDTIFWDCYYDKKTNFTGVGLSGCRVEPVLLSSFQCNIRRIWWENWYRDKRHESENKYKNISGNPVLRFFKSIKTISAFIMTLIVKSFWWITDYGTSTVRLIMVFLMTTFFYATLYTVFPEITNDYILQFSKNIGLVFSRSLYFSVIVMTGLGFGEIHAQPEFLAGHIIIMFQSLMGYILLGAFLVRIGILFQGEFPVSSVRRKKDDKKCDFSDSDKNK